MTTIDAVDDCFAISRGHIDLGEALGLLKNRIEPIVDHQKISLKDAMGRILAEDIISDRDVPAFDNVAVDGYAFAASSLQSDGWTSLNLCDGRAAAGHPFIGTVAANSCLRVLTGAVVPSGTDTIVMQEDIKLHDGTVAIPPGIRPNANRRRKGEDIRLGQSVLQTGQRLAAQHIGVAAELGLNELPVFRPLRIALFSSGDEIVEPGSNMSLGQVFDANRYILSNFLKTLPVEVRDLGILPDHAEDVRQALRSASRDSDVILASGGASKGDEDHVVRTIETDGSLHFWQIAMKPGRPLAFGRLGKALFIGLPGNPVATAVCFLRIARPVLYRLAGADWREPLSFKVAAGFSMKKRAGRSEMLRARLIRDNSNAMIVERITREGSGILTSLTEADGLVELPDQLTSVEEGQLVDFFSFAELNAS